MGLWNDNLHIGENPCLSAFSSTTNSTMTILGLNQGSRNKKWVANRMNTAPFTYNLQSMIKTVHNI
jgi:hypothetical protein